MNKLSLATLQEEHPPASARTDRGTHSVNNGQEGCIKMWQCCVGSKSDTYKWITGCAGGDKYLWCFPLQKNQFITRWKVLWESTAPRESEIWGFSRQHCATLATPTIRSIECKQSPEYGVFLTDRHTNQRRKNILPRFCGESNIGSNVVCRMECVPSTWKIMGSVCSVYELQLHYITLELFRVA